eukprot:10159665-Alexandrium_andersonii.AAC.1
MKLYVDLLTKLNLRNARLGDLLQRFVCRLNLARVLFPQRSSSAVRSAQCELDRTQERPQARRYASEHR